MSEFATTLNSYIAHMQQQAIDGNSCDNRPTYQLELDGIAKEYTEAFERGESVIAGIPPEDLGRCRRLHNARKNPHGYPHLERYLVHARLGKEWILAPAYVFLINEVRTLKDVLA